MPFSSHTWIGASRDRSLTGGVSTEAVYSYLSLNDRTDVDPLQNRYGDTLSNLIGMSWIGTIQNVIHVDASV